MENSSDIRQTAEGFEEMSISNGNTHWSSAKLMEWLGYVSADAFNNVISKAMTVCTTLKINSFEHFKPTESGEFELTRFACYLIAMNGDVKKENVAKAQVYFAKMAEVISQMSEHADNIERVQVRREVTERNTSLSKTASSRGLESYPHFQNAGYMGMYNMGIWDLRRIKGIGDKQIPLDFMRKRELAANLFRLTETEGRIKDNPSIRGQQALEQTAHDVGREVRKVMNAAPEELAHNAL